MASIGPLYPGTATDNGGGSGSWVTIDLAKTVSDDLAVGAVLRNDTTNYADFVNFGFSVPTGATIDGVLVEHRVKEGTGMDGRDGSFKLIVGGTATGVIPAGASSFTTSLTTRSRGGATSLWSCTLTPAVVNASNFGVRLQYDELGGADGNISLAFVRITIYYTPGVSFNGLHPAL